MTNPAPRYTSFPEYILGITEEIWEGRGIHLLHDYYAKDIPVRSPGGIVRGNLAVINATRATLAELPDRQLLGEDVIWDKMGADSWLSSHRIVTLATHLGDGKYGKATGKPVTYRVIADCHAESCPKSGWRINDEWLVRDQGAILRQIGVDLREHARLEVESSRERKEDRPYYFPSDAEPPGPYKGLGNDHEAGHSYADTLTRIMQAESSIVWSAYDRACQLDLPGGKTAHGFHGADRFWLQLCASFPDAVFKVEHRMGRSRQGKGVSVALRWSLAGKHDGWGMFGEPTGARVYVMGMSHAEFDGSRIRREFVLFDETAIWKQIVASTG